MTTRRAEFLSIWAATLVRLRPELGPAEAEAVVHAAIGAINSVALRDSGLPRQDLEPLLRQVARSVLHRSHH